MSHNHSSDAAAAVFIAALQGITANPAFFGPIFQQSPDAAVRFAQECVRAAFNHDSTLRYPDWAGKYEEPIAETNRT